MLGLYSTIKDSDVKVTDAEILAYRRKMKRNLKQRRLVK
jgi:hypothetical protein